MCPGIGDIRCGNIDSWTGFIWKTFRCRRAHQLQTSRRFDIRTYSFSILLKIPCIKGRHGPSKWVRDRDVFVPSRGRKEPAPVPNFLQRKYDLDRKEYKKRCREIANIGSRILKSIKAGYFSYIAECKTVHGMLVALKDCLCPSEHLRGLELKGLYKEALQAYKVWQYRDMAW